MVQPEVFEVNMTAWDGTDPPVLPNRAVQIPYEYDIGTMAAVLRLREIQPRSVINVRLRLIKKQEK